MKYTDEHWMSLAIVEARKGQGKTSPNPCVGAVLVKGNRLLAKGYHRKAGLPHAEMVALRKVKRAKKATLYVTLEPCCHQNKRTPPCVDSLIASGLERIVIGTRDPNPKVRGKGIRKLRRAGMNVKVGVCKKECKELNPYYNHWMKTKRPWVILKAATTLDGRVALANGQSKWITGPKARRRVHQFRSQVDGVMVGIGTVLKDNPRLNVRLKKTSPQPVRLVWDPRLDVPPKAKILSSKNAGPTWILTRPSKARSSKARKLKGLGVEVLPCRPGPHGKLPAGQLLSLIGKRGIQSLLVEGGPGIWTQFYSQGAADELLLFMAPKFLGAEARPLLGPLGKKGIPGPPDWELKAWEAIGQDLFIRFRLS